MQTSQVTVAELMSHPVMVVRPDMRVSEVLELADENAIHHFPIVVRGKLIGIVCTCDLRDARPETPVSELGQWRIVTIPWNSSATDAARLMNANAVGSAIVTNGRNLCGILTREDLARAPAGLEFLIAEGRCTACGTQQHLRAGTDGFLCVECEERAGSSDWFESGEGD
jgi:predicted transcriptional regulator